MIALSCHGIGKSYGHFQVLHDINLTIVEGECFALFGPNGAGKTTLLKILATLQRPSTGYYEGLPVMQVISIDTSVVMHAVMALVETPPHACHVARPHD